MFIQLFDGEKTFDTVMLRNPEITPNSVIKVRGAEWKVITILFVNHERIVVWVKEA